MIAGASGPSGERLKLYEYQAKERFAAAGVPVLPGRLCGTPDEAARAAVELGGAVVVKAQVPAGGRGKAGGVRRAAGSDEAAERAAELLGRPLLGLPVRRVWLEPLVEVERELYLAFALDAPAGWVVFLLGPGGVDVEARSDAIFRAPIDLAVGLPLFLVRDGLLSIGLPQTLAVPLHGVAAALLEALKANAAVLAEVNPLALVAGAPPEVDGAAAHAPLTQRSSVAERPSALSETGRGFALLALDARMEVDDGALERLPEVARWVREGPEEFPEEHLQLTLGFDFVELDPEGDVGLLSTGAGLTMAVIDLLRERGARPVNFVDLRTGSMGRDPTRLRYVLDRLTARPTLRAVLVNVFAGITNLEEFAHGLLAALEGYPSLRGRVVVRGTGTGFAGAEAIWRAAGLTVTEDLGEAIELALEARAR